MHEGDAAFGSSWAVGARPPFLPFTGQCSWVIKPKFGSWGHSNRPGQMLNFFATTAVIMFDPVIVVSGVLIGYLFHADMKKVAWGLLFFVLPALPTLWRVADQGMFLSGVAQLGAASVVAAVCYRGLEFSRTRSGGPPGTQGH
jgi:hypothetical protein